MCWCIWLVVYLPLWKMSSSVGMIIPNIWKNKKTPNHQSALKLSAIVEIIPLFCHEYCIHVWLYRCWFTRKTKIYFVFVWFTRTYVFSWKKMNMSDSSRIFRQGRPSAGPISMVWPSICLGWFCWKTQVVSVQDFRVGYQ